LRYGERERIPFRGSGKDADERRVRLKGSEGAAMHLTGGPPDLRTRLGGEAALSAIVDNFYLRVTSDALIAPVFARVDLLALRQHQQQFLNTVIEAPSEPTATYLREAHQNLQITPRQFGALLLHLQAALREAEVPDAVIAELIETVEQYADDVIGR